MNYVTKIGDKVFDFVLDVSIRHLGYIIYYKGNVVELKQGVEALEDARERVGHRIEDAKNNVNEIEADVKAWYEKANNQIDDGKKFEEDEGHTKTGCSRGILPFLWYRHKLGRTAKKMATANDKLLIEGSNLPEVVSYHENPRADTALSNDGYVEFGSRKKTMENIMKQLKDSTVRVIGVHGPGGVGKTTFVNQIAKQARDNYKLFDKVVKVSITRNPSLQKIQEEIAYYFGLTFEGESENGRADLLKKRLQQENGNTLLILDDLWDELNLHMLGIPFDDDNGFGHVGAKMVKSEDSQAVNNGCKVLLTSRIMEVLHDKMNVKKHSIFLIKELDLTEAVALFKKVAEISDENSKFKPEIVEKYCAGLPVAIITVGKALRNKSESVWEDTLEKLKKQELMGVQNYMEISVKMSYDQLESEELKSIFLLSAQMGHQPLIVDLVRYSFGLGMLKGVHSLAEARDRVSKSIQKLKDSNLLLDVNSGDHFNMHDMVRDAALSIAQKDQNVFTLRNDKLDDWPDELVTCTAISIHKSDIVDELPQFINCPQLKVFHIESDTPTLNIPDGFFARMEKLRVLKLIGIHLPSLPSSIKCLSNLRMLCLERCTLGNLSIIGCLKKLRILSLSGSKIEDWPAELGDLSKLQLLDISDCSMGNLIPRNLVSRLTSLEELYIRKSLLKVTVEGETRQSQVFDFSELKNLHKLKILDVCFPSSDVFPEDLFFEELDDYKIVIGFFKTFSIGDFKMPQKYEASRSLALHLKAGTDIHSLKGIKILFKGVENMLLGELNGVQNAFYELNLDGFPNLKNLSIIDNTEIEYIVNSMELSHPLVAFPNLESLSLFNLLNLRKICCSPVTKASFSRLKTIRVKMCTKLNNLFSFYIVKFLDCLEAIDVSECYNFKEIVVDEGEVSQKVEFDKLCSLTLETLPSFIGFYTNKMMLSTPQCLDTQEESTDQIDVVTANNEQTVTTFLHLFGEQVEIPNLETLNLFSINIQKIWSDRVPSLCFQNLIKLTVEDCCNLNHLCSLSVASNLKKLKGLFVSACHKMEKLFTIEGDSNDYSKERIFPKLEEISLYNMDMLKELWPTQVRADSFPSLTTVRITSCPKLEKIFPSQIQGWYRNLESLTVSFCTSLEVIFEIRCPPQEGSSFQADTKLKNISLYSLGSLKQIWSRDPEGVVNLKNLGSIEVVDCVKLSNMLPVSVAKGLEKLEVLSIRGCSEMEEIVAGSGTSNEEALVFPELTKMIFSEMKNINCFDVGKHTIECPKLKHLAVSECPKLELFTKESASEEGRPVFSAETVISNLEHLEMSSDSEEAKWLQSNGRKYLMHHLKRLSLRSVTSVEFLYWLLHRIPNLEMLDLYEAKIEELVPRGNTAQRHRLGTVLRLKGLALKWSDIKDIGFERDPILQRLERLVIYNCSMLIKLAHSSVSFTLLTYLEVSNCPSLKNLMASSTAKSLVRLKTMKLFNCTHLDEIVTDEGNEEEKIVFDNLITLELVRLQDLISFCSYKNCEFVFPSMEKLILMNCPKMKTFTEGYTRASKLQDVLIGEDGDEEKWPMDVDLNATIRMVFFECKSLIELDNYPELAQVWCGKDLVPENSFRNLKTLVVAAIDYLVHVIPSHLLHCFKNLEVLEVRDCPKVQVIFNINDNRLEEASMVMFHLQMVSLRGLPKLQHIWDKDPADGIIALPNLQYLDVDSCSSLRYVFPASVAKDLAMLEQLSISCCDQMMGIFAGDEAASKGDTKSFVFPRVVSLDLRELPKLKYFYPELHNLEFPKLKFLNVEQCQRMMLTFQEAGGANLGGLLIPVGKMQRLEELSFDMVNGTLSKWHAESLKLELENSVSLDSAVYRFLQTVSNVENLEVRRSNLEEMFSTKRRHAKYAGVLSHLKRLTLHRLAHLKSIGLEHSWIHPIPENLQTLEIDLCDQLKNLVPAAGTVSFSNLTDLTVSFCNNMLYLFTSSTAKSLARLKRMKVWGCESMQEIVFKEGDESDECGNIVFEQLQVLHLEELPRVRWFYSGKYTLCFPSLEKVSVIKCFLMKTFCPHIILNHDSNILLLDRDLDTYIRKMNDKEFADSARDLEYLRLDKNPHFQEVWCGSVPVPDACFSNLESLFVEGCEFLSEVLPSNLLPFLNKMQYLEVRNCSNVKTIFDVECLRKDQKMTMGPALLPFPFLLNALVLDKLPNLESVWNEDPEGLLTVKVLQYVQVDTCKCLTNLFPTSVTKDLVELEHLEVKHCEGLSEIVARDEKALGGTNLEFTFPCLTSLTLLNLPNLKCFYCSLRCVQLRRFGDQDPHTEDQACVREITPNLDKLSLGQKELKMIWHGNCQGNHSHKVEVLELQFFNVELNELTFGSTQKLPNIEKLVVRSSSMIQTFSSERPNKAYTGLLSQLVPPSTCFSTLMSLSLFDCDGMLHLFTSSTAKSFGQLKEVKISSCKSMREIVSKDERDESHHDDEIIFEHLQELNLKSLPNLEGFYKGNLPLRLPSLERLSIVECGRMDSFCVSTLSANKLSEVRLSYDRFIDDIDTPTTLLEDDLNFTIHKAFNAQLAKFVQRVKDLKLADQPEVHEIWHGSFPVPFHCFINLRSLIIERCEFLSNAIPSHILVLLSNLEELVVRQSHSIKAIFEVKDILHDTKKPNTEKPFGLKKLTFEQLPNLEYVWDSDPQQVIELQNLQEVCVNRCDNLKRLFPASMAKSLMKLEKLEVQHCGRLVEIVAKDEADTEGAPKEFVMPCMTSIKLRFLPELKCFYPAPHKLEFQFPVLKQVHLFHCDKLKTFTCEAESFLKAKPEYQGGIPWYPQTLFLAEKVPNLEFLALNKEETIMIWLGKFHVNLLHKLQALQLQCFHDDSDNFPYGFLRKVPNIEKFVVSCSSFKEIFCSERPMVDCAEEILSRVKRLQLSSLSKLNSIGLEHSWVDTISERLETLQIDECHCLRNIVPCKVSFSSLIDLNVSQCGGLVYLFTHSTSRTLCQLKNMSVENCESLEEIISGEADELSNHNKEEIVFHKLETLSLKSLPRLGRFYGGSVDLCLPSLDELTIINCSKMEGFCGGAITVNVNRWTTLKCQENEEGSILKVDLNSAIRKAFEGTGFSDQWWFMWLAG